MYRQRELRDADGVRPVIIYAQRSRGTWVLRTSHLTLHTSKYALKLRTFTSAELCGWVVRPVLSASRLPAAALPGLHY